MNVLTTVYLFIASVCDDSSAATLIRQICASGQDLKVDSRVQYSYTVVVRHSVRILFGLHFRTHDLCYCLAD
jgi:hypothetical protein